MKKLYLVVLVLVVAMVLVSPVAAAPALQGEDPEGEEEAGEGPLVNVENSVGPVLQMAAIVLAALALAVSNRWIFEKLVSGPVVENFDSDLLKKAQPVLVTLLAIGVAQIFNLDLATVMSEVVGIINAPVDPATGQLLTGVASGLGAIYVHEYQAGKTT